MNKMNLPSLKDFNFKDKKVLLRLNLDVPLAAGGSGFEISDTSRIDESLKTVNFLLNQQPAKIIIISHLGRPSKSDGKADPNFSLLPVAKYLDKKIGKKVKALGIELYLRENLRFDKGEEENSFEFAKKLAFGSDVFVNDAFGASHRNHASITQLPRLLPTFFGLNFLKEMKLLTKIKENPCRPVVLLLGGAKSDKMELAKKLIYWVDFVLIGGRLAEFNGLPVLAKHPKVIADLAHNGKDINQQAIDIFAPIIKKAGTIIWAGPMGAFEESRYATGTRQIGNLVTSSKAFTVIGGGDTESALSQFNLIDKINYVSTGGGAMLFYLAHGTLPAITAILKDK